MEICRKKNDSLKKFSGTVGEFQIWRDRIVDHLARDNHRWRGLLETLQTWQTPITVEWFQTQSECGYNASDLSQKLEAFLVEHMTDSLYRRRRQLAGGSPKEAFQTDLRPSLVRIKVCHQFRNRQESGIRNVCLVCSNLRFLHFK